MGEKTEGTWAGSQPEVALGVKQGLGKGLGLGLRVGQGLGLEKQWGHCSPPLDWREASKQRKSNEEQLQETRQQLLDTLCAEMRPRDIWYYLC